MDVKKSGDSGKENVKGGREEKEKEEIEWAKKGVENGEGEIEVKSKEEEGRKKGKEKEKITEITKEEKVQVIASGGAGKVEDFVKAAKDANCDGILAASVFHYGEIKIGDLTEYMKSKGIEVRL